MTLKTTAATDDPEAKPNRYAINSSVEVTSVAPASAKCAKMYPWPA
jgi:hypothetical protein